MKNNIQYLKEEAKIYERGILTLLLEISRSFSDENFTKQKRDEIFVKIDGLRDKIKDINKVISDLQESEENIEEVYAINKTENVIDNLIELEEKSEEILEENTYSNLNDVIESVEEVETIQTEETIDSEVVQNYYGSEIELEEENIRRRNRGRRSRRNVSGLNDNKNNSIENEYKEIVNENNNHSNDIENIDDNDLVQDIEEIDRLIEEAQNLNNNIIKFPESRRKRIENNENPTLDTLKEEKEVKCEESNIDDDIVEPVPVLFGNSRAQNQMIVRKKSNGFSDKLKSLIFKIKTLLGGEDEE